MQARRIASRTRRAWPGCLALLITLSTTAATRQGAYLGDMTWPEAEKALRESPLVILPFAAGAKEHGRHLPMNADQRLMEHLVEVAVEETNSVVAPPVLYGWFPAFREFPGTEIENPSVFQDYVFLAAKSLIRSGAQRVVLLNTGIAKATGLPISIAAREIRASCGVPALVVNWDDLETSEVAQFSEQAWGGHADEIETSINLALKPASVHMERAEKDLGRAPKSYPGYRPGGFSPDPDSPLHSAQGIRGDPTLASAEKGHRALAIMRENWLLALREFATEPIPRGPRPCAREVH